MFHLQPDCGGDYGPEMLHWFSASAENAGRRRKRGGRRSKKLGIWTRKDHRLVVSDLSNHLHILELTAYNTKWCLGALRKIVPVRSDRALKLGSLMREAASIRPSLADSQLKKTNKFTAIDLHCPPEHKRPFPNATGEWTFTHKRRRLHHLILSSTADKCLF